MNDQSYEGRFTTSAVQSDPPSRQPANHDEDEEEDELPQDVYTVPNPMKDLPPLGYEVQEEQPPYSTGHQCLRTFTKIFIHNIEFQVTREGLLRTFNKFGRIKNINMPFDSRNRPRGLAFVIYETHRDA